MNIDWTKVADAFRVGEKVVEAAAPIITGASPLAGGFAAGIGAGMGLAADLIEHGMHPIETITRIRSSLPDFDAVTRELENYAAGR